MQKQFLWNEKKYRVMLLFPRLRMEIEDWVVAYPSRFMHVILKRAMQEGLLKLGLKIRIKHSLSDEYFIDPQKDWNLLVLAV